ncbi:MAG: aminotransferase class V-fold PLP-dependent enzyme [Thermoanaerobaculia bacterium]|nr:MAG: aminotransferase class V-fold PLP-dependent enzyme [Thermoanaerobaculia bacterium]MBZ0101795.1 aminotransferase class V-fold PLP-dependent enzyme [Thermoanaerobaculia bacterium]
MRSATRCVHLRDDADPHAASVPPLYQTATFRQPGAAEAGEFDYSRTDNPTRRLLETQLAGLEGGRHAFAYGSGMAALAALLRLVEPGGEILAGDDLYGGTTRWLARVAPLCGVAVRHLDATDPERVAAAIGRRTRLLLVETPSNPRLRIAPLAALAAVARRRGVRLAVDNSLLSPLLQRPLALGADLVVHSATKILGGHGDLTAGVVVVDDEVLAERLAFHRNAEGAALAPFEAWLLLRGLKTLALRVEQQGRSAALLAHHLAADPRVRRVWFPELPGHPGRELHAAQAAGPGPLLAFETGDPELSRRLVDGLRLFAVAVSFGSVASAATLPFRLSHAAVPEPLRDRLAPPPDLVRLAVGLEDPRDLIEDLEQAWAGATASRTLAAGGER